MGNNAAEWAARVNAGMDLSRSSSIPSILKLLKETAAVAVLDGGAGWGYQEAGSDDCRTVALDGLSARVERPGRVRDRRQMPYVVIYSFCPSRRQVSIASLRACSGTAFPILAALEPDSSRAQTRRILDLLNAQSGSRYAANYREKHKQSP